MGQIWNRIRRLAQSYAYDSPLYSYESVEEEDQRRLKEIIDQLNQKPPAGQQASAGQQQANAGQGNKQKRENAEPTRPQGMTMESALAVLGLPPNAPGEDIKKSYKRLMLKYHPDRVATLSATEQEAAHRRAQELNAAYQFIKQHKKL